MFTDVMNFLIVAIVFWVLGLIAGRASMMAQMQSLKDRQWKGE